MQSKTCTELFAYNQSPSHCSSYYLQLHTWSISSPRKRDFFYMNANMVFDSVLFEGGGNISNHLSANEK